ncbi:MAG: T9SS type A sorting domain-containing protein [Salinivirgaceae bacterium]|nr:T9SS type A sorting domain-containing protein [Salinivirgaceae bacterium]
MKKSILIASVVALAMGAQAQVDEWVNPLKDLCENHQGKIKDYGVFDYVQKESDMELGKWYLYYNKGLENKNKYPTVVNYNDEMFIRINGDDYYSFAIILKKENLNNVSVKYNAIHFDDNGEETPLCCIKSRITFFNVRDYNNLDSSEVFNKAFTSTDLQRNDNTSYFYANDEFKTFSSVKDYVYIRLAVVKGEKEIAGGYCLINNIEIKFEGYNSTVSKKYFYEPYYINESNQLDYNCSPEDHTKYMYEKYPNLPELYPDIYGYLATTTSINDNDMESNIYVSNNVLHTDEPSCVYIFNASGILVKTENNTTSVDLFDLKKGVYIAKVNGAPIRFVR